jgi:tRNA (uracil-5-)-methyltransferase TRM9
MEESVIQRLLSLNQQFYQTFAGAFSATRQRIQPGMRRLLPGLAEWPRLLA